MGFSTTRTQIDLCVNCYHGVEYYGGTDAAYLGLSPETLAQYRETVKANGIDPEACHQSTYRLSDGSHEMIPTTYSDARCDGCGSTKYGERFMYDYLPEDEGEDLGWTGL